MIVSFFFSKTMMMMNAEKVIQNTKIFDSIEKKGALATFKKGLISVDEFQWAQRFEAELKCLKRKFDGELEDMRAQKERLIFDVPKGVYLSFNCHKTGKSYMIRSEKANVTDERFVKRKHYYFYSIAPNYGKTTLAHDLLEETNAWNLLDFDGEMQVSQYAQFLVIDEAGPDRMIDTGNLKCLTSGLAFACSGDVQPRDDVQLIFFSHRHLFDVIGELDPKDGTRKIDKWEANILLDRFFIYRLDETETETEEFDRRKHTSSIV